jgi:hypothetical protein
MLTLWSRLVIIFLIDFMMAWSSFTGPTTRLSISSSSGLMAVRSSSSAVWYVSTFLIVCAACGYFPRRSYSEAMGWNKLEKCWAMLPPDVKSAAFRGKREREGVTSKGGQFVNEEATRHMLFTASVNVFVSFRNFSAAVSSKAKLRW